MRILFAHRSAKIAFSLFEAVISMSLLGLVLALVGMLSQQYLRLSGQHNDRSKTSLVLHGLLQLAHDLKSAVELVVPGSDNLLTSELRFTRYDPARPRFPSPAPTPCPTFLPGGLITVHYYLDAGSQHLLRRWGEQPPQVLLTDIQGFALKRESRGELELSLSYVGERGVQTLRHRVCLWNLR